jgi:2-oxoisovalerate dehydrogenase E1 component beta subunit
MFLEPKRIYRHHKGEVPEGEHVVPLGKGRVVREGTDVTLVAWGAMVSVCEKAAEEAEKKGRSVEIIDPRTLVPLDEQIILESVKKTGRAVMVYEAPKTSGFGGEIAAILAEKAIEYLEGPIVRVAGFDTPFPYALETSYMPDVRRVLKGIDKTFAW